MVTEQPRFVFSENFFISDFSTKLLWKDSLKQLSHTKLINNTASAAEHIANQECSAALLLM